MGGWWITDLLNSPNINGQVWVVSWAVWVVLSICLHELAHGWAAIRLGDDTPIVSGHMTWNPMVHMGGYSLIIFLLLGIAWGLMPVNPSRMRGRYAETIVASAGPLMNIALFLVSMVLLLLWVPLAQGSLNPSWSVPDPLATNMQTFLALGAMLNIVLFMFNLLPIPPLDGSRIMMNLCPPYQRMLMSETGRWIMLAGFIIVFVFLGSFLFGIAMVLVEGGSQLVWSLLFPGMDAPSSLFLF